jgi:hypothetical protein
MTLAPNTQITQENVECGGCGETDAAKRCIGCLHAFRPALSPPAEGVSDEYRQAIRDVNNMRDDGTIKPPHTLTSAPVDHIGDATEKVDWARCQRCGGEIQGWICQDCHQEFEENDAGELVFCPSEAVDWTVVGPKLVEALELASRRFYVLRDMSEHTTDRVCCATWGDEARETAALSVVQSRDHSS